MAITKTSNDFPQNGFAGHGLHGKVGRAQLFDEGNGACWEGRDERDYHQPPEQLRLDL